MQSEFYGKPRLITENKLLISYLYTHAQSQDRNSWFLRWIHHRIQAVGTGGARRAAGVPKATPYTLAGVWQPKARCNR